VVKRANAGDSETNGGDVISVLRIEPEEAARRHAVAGQRRNRVPHPAGGKNGTHRGCRFVRHSLTYCTDVKEGVFEA
jgi:hypothetical protein